MNKHENSTRNRVQRALDCSRKLVDPESYSGFNITASDLDALAELRADKAAADKTRRWLKEKIRLYVTTWIIPELEEAAKKLTKPKPEKP